MGTDHAFCNFLTRKIPSIRLLHAGHPCRIFAVSTARRLSACRAALAWLSRTYPGTSSSDATTVRTVCMKTVTTSISWKSWWNRQPDILPRICQREGPGTAFRRGKTFSAGQAAFRPTRRTYPALPTKKPAQGLFYKSL